MKNQVTMRRDLGPKEEVVEYIEFIDDLKKGIIAISAMLNSRRSVTLYFGVNDAGRVVFAVPTKYFSRKTLHVSKHLPICGKGWNPLREYSTNIRMQHSILV